MAVFAKQTVAIILGGGAGSRLYPLTASRSKPAVPIAGKYRLVDIPISNCINSNLNRIFVLITLECNPPIFFLFRKFNCFVIYLFKIIEKKLVFVDSTPFF